MTLATVPRYDQDAVSSWGDRAVVVGGSVAGLLAARVLADGFDSVVVLERDELPDDPTSRDGVPQDTEIHALLEAGRSTIEDLCPGYCESLLAAGGVLFDGATDLRFYGRTDFLADGPRRIPAYSATRPLFETVLRDHVTTLPNVALRDGCRVTDYELDDAGTRVTGISVREGSDDPERLAADLIVDATGRASRTPQWLEAHDFDAPPVDEVTIDLVDATAVVERPSADRTGVLALASAPRTRGGAAFPIEDDRWLVNVHGFHGDHPPTDVDGMTAFAETLPTDAIARLLREHDVENVSAYRFPSNRRRYYESLDDDAFPEGLVVVGDAIASFNPIYGQGMSVAAMEALVLHHALADGGLRGLASRFFERTADVVDVPWRMALGSDVQFEETTGPTPRGVGLFGRYFDRAFRVAQDDGELRELLMEIISMQKPPESLLRPRSVGRVLAGSLPSTDALRERPTATVEGLADAIHLRPR